MSHPLSRRDALRLAGAVPLSAAAAALLHDRHNHWTEPAAHRRAPDTAAPDRLDAYLRPREIAARPVAGFLDSLGVNAHIGQGVDDAAECAPGLRYAGIAHLRDDANAAYVSDWITLYQQSGTDLDLLANGSDPDVGDPIAMATSLRQAGALVAVEGPNEPNNQPVTYNGVTSSSTSDFTPVAQYQQALYHQVKTTPALRGIPVFASSEAGGSEPNNVGLQFLTIPSGAGTLMPDGTRYADFANTHTYPDRSPGWTDNMAWFGADPTLDGAWDGLYGEYGVTWLKHFQGYSDPQLAALPRVMTETGWATQGSGSITEAQQGNLILCLYLSNFTRGWKQTYIYMLRDDPVQGYWGLLDTEYQPKLSGVYVHNLTTILAEPARSLRAPSTGRLAYQVSGPATVHDVLLQKSDGTLWLAIWNEAASGSDGATVSFATPPSTVTLYDPTSGTSATRTFRHPSTVELSLGSYGTAVLRIQ